MKKTLLALSLLTLAALASPARAEDRGFTLGVRTAFALPLGEAVDGTDLADLSSGAVPVQLDLGYRLSPSWEVGGYFAWGYAMIADDAKDGLRALGLTDVGGHRVQRVGLQAAYTILPAARFAPWVGLGLGYEWDRYAQAKAGGDEIEIGFRGLEAILQVGGDYRVSPRFTVGPFATLNVGQYRTALAWEEDGDETSEDVDETGLHQWIQLGVRGTFDF